jgi:septal ring-binding cell division protein DamX
MMALQNFADLIARYPDSKYSADARERSTQLKLRLADMALVSAKDRLSQGDYEGAALGASAIREDFPDTAVVAEALTVEKMARHMLGTNFGEEYTVEGGGSSAAAAPAGAAPPTADTTVPPLATTKTTMSTETPVEATAGQRSVTADRPQAAGTPGSLRTEKWINIQDPAAYTIQVMSSANRGSLIGFAKRYGLESEVAYFETRHQGKPWHVAVYGIYDTVSAARAALGNLPEDVRRRRPWIRNMSDVQAAITLTALETQNATTGGE